MTEIIKPGYTRITEILAPFAGYGNVPLDILENACRRGEQTHDAIEAHFNGLGDLFEKTEDVAKYYQSFMEFLEHDFPIETKTVFIEKRFYEDVWKITGKMDKVFTHDGKTILIDWKTSANENATWKYQGDGYKLILDANGITLNEAWFVKLCKHGKRPKVFKYKLETMRFINLYNIQKEFFTKTKDESFSEWF